ncbi:MAG: hypothetical protein JRJ59_12680, partial [Deltaproteobacteria bacterium]|nr:hypothetical protein [Deltaproteobacteria bacterium]
ACGQKNETGRTIGRRDVCQHCGADLRACRQCRHYYPGAHNDCRETQAELVVDKDRSNFCDFFQPAQGGPESGPDNLSKNEAQKKWEELFGKK